MLWTELRHVDVAQQSGILVVVSWLQASPQEVLVQSPLHAQRLEKGQVTYMRGEEDWEHAVAAAGSSLVVVEVRVGKA